MSSSSAANAALNYINYPTRVIFRSCKLVPTIVIAVLWNRKHFQLSELVLGVTMSLGMVLFALADFQVSSGSSSYGLLLVSFSVIADSFLPNFQVEVEIDPYILANSSYNTARMLTTLTFRSLLQELLARRLPSLQISCALSSWSAASWFPGTCRWSFCQLQYVLLMRLMHLFL